MRRLIRFLMRRSMSLLLIPIIWKIEVNVHITAIKVIGRVYSESDILANLPPHIVLITFG